jgi:LmbE family N-acetylglucosaminyl deacetylase
MSAPRKLSFSNLSRLMLFAPHPDDESLACSILLQRAVAAGASVRVIYATDGENNPWPQRVIHRKWRLTEFDRARWGKIRRAEAIDALKVLGIPGSSVEFLGLPDQGLTKLLLGRCDRTLSRVSRCITDWLPTDILCPDISDTHPDHSALGVMVQIALKRSPAPIRCPWVWTYGVHGRSRKFLPSTTFLFQTPKETAVKIIAISCHRTQLKLSRRRFLAYAARSESFSPNGSNPMNEQFGAGHNRMMFYPATLPAGAADGEDGGDKNTQSRRYAGAGFGAI